MPPSLLNILSRFANGLTIYSSDKATVYVTREIFSKIQAELHSQKGFDNPTILDIVVRSYNTDLTIKCLPDTKEELDGR